MKKDNNPQTLQEAWSRAVEQAIEPKPAEQELDENKLASAAGLQVKLNLRVGYLLGSAQSVSNCCTVNLSCQ